jgi:hypothetical protein
MSAEEWWKEYGAYVGIYPRQSGKTQAIIQLWEMTPDGKILVFSDRAKEMLMDRGVPSRSIVSSVAAINRIMHVDSVDFFVDEFMYVGQNTMQAVYARYWKTLTLLSSLR